MTDDQFKALMSEIRKIVYLLSGILALLFGFGCVFVLLLRAILPE